MRRAGTLSSWRATGAIAGGLLWLYFGSLLALRPARVPGVSFRASTDVLPWLGLGLVLIALAAGALARRAPSSAGAWQRWAGRGALVGATLYASGHVLRQFLAGTWEPAVPLGLLTTVLSLLLLGGGLLRTPDLPRTTGGAVLASGLCLLVFNDQYLTAWAAVPFGLLWIGLGALVLRRDAETPLAAPYPALHDDERPGTPFRAPPVPAPDPRQVDAGVAES